MRMEGLVQAAVENRGSKSEGRRFHIVNVNGDKIRLQRLGDNPFTNESLAGFEGSEVEVTGDLDGNTFLVDQIKKKS